jgi:nucleotide-binding universal stress UspA family protein
MFSNLLVPISGDAITKKGLSKVAKLAKQSGAKITLAFVSDPLAPYIYTESVNGLMISEAAHKKACAQFAQRLFAKARKVLGDSITVDVCHVIHPNIADGIIQAAKKTKADVIVMASHKYTGLKGIFLGSEAHEVILHSTLPVLTLA